MPNVSHYVFVTIEGDVLREMNAFIAVLGFTAWACFKPTDNT